jgi:hypothetical protein
MLLKVTLRHHQTNIKQTYNSELTEYALYLHLKIHIDDDINIYYTCTKAQLSQYQSV